MNDNHSNGNDDAGVEWLELISVKEICQLHETFQDNVVLRGLFCLYGSWNKDLKSAEAVLKHWRPTVGPGRRFVTGMVQVDASDESLDAFCGDNGGSICLDCHPLPDELPALLAVVQESSLPTSLLSSTSRRKPRMQIVREVTAQELLKEGPSPRIMKFIKATFNSLILGISNVGPSKRKRKMVPNTPVEEALRIFVAGDRANVGKTSVCLGLLGSLVARGYDPASIAYIKPATQDESQQLLQVYCDQVGISCIPIGPIVFYKGFTRAFLAGEAETPAAMLGRVAQTVNELSVQKRVVVIDGVGYPAVGSICGVDNASVALACGYSDHHPLGVILVGPSGVGHAVDSFNLNANYFDSRLVPVMGAIFNKIELDGYYSLENCREQISSYFRQYQPMRKAFGFLPSFPKLAGNDAINHLDEFFRIFSENVDVTDILECARKIKRSSPSSSTSTSSSSAAVSIQAKKSKTDSMYEDEFNNNNHQSSIVDNTRVKTAMLSRQQIESQAKAQGAIDSC